MTSTILTKYHKLSQYSLSRRLVAWSRSLLVLIKACSTLCLGKPMSVRACKR